MDPLKHQTVMMNQLQTCTWKIKIVHYLHHIIREDFGFFYSKNNEGEEDSENEENCPVWFKVLWGYF